MDNRKFLEYKLFLFILCGLALASSTLACETEIGEEASETSILYFEKGCYDVVSNDKRELLSCSPTMVAEGHHLIISYLACEESPIETESASAILVRLSYFSLDNIPNSLGFIDVAKANTYLFGHNAGVKSPYDPNLIRLNTNEYLCLYREGGNNGTYICCNISLADEECYNYRPLTLDGQIMNPENAISSYKTISFYDTQSVHLVFLTRIIKDDSFFYGYLGGYGFNGILMRSQNGVDWDSITSPDLPEGMTYIIEGAIGKDPITNNMFLCGRGDDVMFCGYDMRFQQIIPPRLLPGTTTSRPTMFTYHDHLYLIVNMQNDVEYSTGRRNTANVYRINGSTGELTLVKTLKCKDGCAYHSVQVVDDEIWVVFQTDGRHIALEDQGRSNLALVKLLLT